MKAVPENRLAFVQSTSDFRFDKMLLVMLLPFILSITACGSTGSGSASGRISDDQLLPPTTESVTPPRPSSNSGSGSKLAPSERGAIAAVQKYTIDGSNTVTDWLTVVMAAQKGMGRNIDLTGAYWSARDNGQRIQVRFFYKEDGEWRYVEWRYVPNTGFVAGENELGRLTVR